MTYIDNYSPGDIIEFKEGGYGLVTQVCGKCGSLRIEPYRKLNHHPERGRLYFNADEIKQIVGHVPKEKNRFVKGDFSDIPMQIRHERHLEIDKFMCPPSYEWRDNAIDEYRKGIPDLDWWQMQRIGEPIYKAGDVIEFKSGGYGAIVEVYYERTDYPPLYKISPRQGLQFYSLRKREYFYEGDIEGVVSIVEVEK